MQRAIFIAAILACSVVAGEEDGPLFQYIKKGDWASVVAAVEKDPSLISKNDAKAGNTILHWAILSKDATVVEGLLQRSKLKSVDGMKNKRGELTPLHMAALTGDPTIFTVILKLSQNVNERMADGSTALCLAVSSLKKEMVQALLDKGADLEISNGLDQTPLIIAILSGKDDSTKLLIEKGANVRVTALNQTSLHWAMLGGRKEICELLISRDKTLVDLAGDEGDTPLHVAAEQGYVEFTKLLLKHGADARSKNKKGRTPVVIATKQWEKTKDSKYFEILTLMK